MKKLFIFSIVLLAFAVRLYKISEPLADWHSWRQTDTSAVSRNYARDGINLLLPRHDDLSDIASGRENPNGYFFVEFPIYNAIHAFVYQAIGFFSLEVWGRLVSILFSLGSLVFLYLIVDGFLGALAAILSAVFFAFLPFNVYYSRVILPEPMMVFASLASIYFYRRYFLSSKRMYLLAGILSLGLSLLLKPFSILFFVPIFYLAFVKANEKLSDQLRLTAFSFVLASMPFILWRLWISRFPEGIPGSYWLFNSGGIRFKGAFFYWIFAERIAKLILGYWGGALLIIGLIRKTREEKYFFHVWLLSVLAYFFVVAGGNVQHDYYQVISVPIICVFLAKGVEWLFDSCTDSEKILSKVVALVLSVFAIAFSWYHIRDFYNINNPSIVSAGKSVDRLIPVDAKVIAPYGGDTAFLYQTNRKGWPVGVEIQKMIDHGAEYYVNINFGPETDWLEKEYCVMEKTSSWIIIKLDKSCHKK